ncbi:MAG: hypothetical protein WCP59_06125 [Actinomycetota bacterium]
MLIGYSLAIFAAFAYGYSAILQAQGARIAMEVRTNRARAMLRQPRLLLGIALDLLAWVTSRVALGYLPLFAVQTVLAGSIAITVLLASILLGTRIGTVERRAIAATCVALVVIGMAAEPNHDVAFSAAVRVGIVAALPVLVIGGLTLGRRYGAIMQAVLAGLAFVGSAMAARTLNFDNGWSGLLSSPVAWSVVGYALCGTWLHAVALGRGGAGQVTAAMWATEVVAAVLIGLLLLDETVRSGWAVPAALAILTVLVSTVALARSSAEVHSEAHGHPHGGAVDEVEAVPGEQYSG